MTDYATFQHGGIQFPLALSGTTGNTLLRDADPTLFYVLDFYAYVLTTFIGARLLADAAAIGAPITSVVAQTVPFPAEVYGLSDQFQFPLLCAWRKSGRFNRRTAVWEHDTGAFGVAWILPTLTAGQAEKLLPVLHAAGAALNYMTDQGWSPSYTPPGGSAGQQPWSAPFADLEEIGLEAYSVGAYQGFNSALSFPAVTLDGYVKEKANKPADSFSGVGPYAGGDLDIQSTDTTQSTVDQVTQVATQLAPTISSLSVTSGTINGGTSVTITGTLFLSGPTVTFGNVAATSVVMASSTSVTCVTPAHNPGAVDVVLTNSDGQSVTLAASFTFS